VLAFCTNQIIPSTAPSRQKVVQWCERDPFALQQSVRPAAIASAALDYFSLSLRYYEASRVPRDNRISAPRKLLHPPVKWDSSQKIIHVEIIKGWKLLRSAEQSLMSAHTELRQSTHRALPSFTIKMRARGYRCLAL
jgi:hypothetical protein